MNYGRVYRSCGVCIGKYTMKSLSCQMKSEKNVIEEPSNTL